MLREYDQFYSQIGRDRGNTEKEINGNASNGEPSIVEGQPRIEGLPEPERLSSAADRSNQKRIAKRNIVEANLPHPHPPVSTSGTSEVYPSQATPFSAGQHYHSSQPIIFHGQEEPAQQPVGRYWTEKGYVFYGRDYLYRHQI